MARDSKRNFAGTAHEIKLSTFQIAAVIYALRGDEQGEIEVNKLIEQGDKDGGESAHFSKAIERILTGERNEESLCQHLSTSASIIEAILLLIKMLPLQDKEAKKDSKEERRTAGCG
ncbi:hypothetical protein [Candidatus Electrothrix sp.]|uniref:hypothetical protein n=1 Tax=Candidatus Electrothrix sp. TaxID=2170559 RepID=UPI0040566E57